MTRWQDKVYDAYTGSLTQYYGWRVVNKTRNGTQWDIDIFNEKTGERQSLYGVGNLSISAYSDNTFLNGPELGNKITKIALGPGTIPAPKSMITARGAGKVTATRIEW